MQARTNGNGHVTPLLLRPASDDAPRISTSTLPDYLRTLRSTKPNLRVHIWLPERPSTTSDPPKITSPIILQASIPNLFVLYVTLVEESRSPSSPDEVLRPQKMVVFGPREKVTRFFGQRPSFYISPGNFQLTPSLSPPVPPAVRPPSICFSRDCRTCNPSFPSSATCPRRS